MRWAAVVILAFIGGSAYAQVPERMTICDGANSASCTPYGSAYPQVITGNTNINTYSAAIHNFGNSSAGDIFCIAGSATKIVKVKGVRVSAIASQAVNSSISIIRRSTLNSGGTPSSVTIVPNDTNNPASTATVTAYATAPTPGTQVGIVRSQKLSIATATTTAFAANPALFQFSVYWDQPLILRGVNQNICVDVDATAGGTWEVDEEHTEE